MAFILAQKWVGFTIKATVTVGLIWVVLGNQDLDRLAERLSGMTVWSVFLAAVLLIVQNVLASVRWFIVMHLFGRAYRIPWPFGFTLKAFCSIRLCLPRSVVMAFECTAP